MSDNKDLEDRVNELERAKLQKRIAELEAEPGTNSNEKGKPKRRMAGLALAITLLVVSVGCKPTDAQIQEAMSKTQTAMARPVQIHYTLGCTNKFALNYDRSATANDGTCKYPPAPAPIVPGCTDSKATNYTRKATWMNGTCQYPPAPAGKVPGCTDPEARNLNRAATWNDGSCVYKLIPITGCTDWNATNHVLGATVDDLSCVYPPLGCTDPNAANFKKAAKQSDGSCTYSTTPMPGCTDPKATNFDSAATQDDGSCKYPPKTDLPGGCTEAELKSDAVTAYIQNSLEAKPDVINPAVMETWITVVEEKYNGLPQCVKNYLEPYETPLIASMENTIQGLNAVNSGDIARASAITNAMAADANRAVAEFYRWDNVRTANGH